MHFYEHPTNVAARASSGGERSRWRDEGIDPELVADPYDTLQAVCQGTQQQAAAREAAAQQTHRPLSFDVARQAMEHSGVEMYQVSPILEAVHVSFNR